MFIFADIFNLNFKNAVNLLEGVENFTEKKNNEIYFVRYFQNKFYFLGILERNSF